MEHSLQTTNEQSTNSIEVSPSPPVYMYKDLQPKCGAIGVFTTINEYLPSATSPSEVFISSGSSPYGLNDVYNNNQQRRALRINVDNDTLCFFEAILSCPSARDMYTLGTEGYHTGILPTGSDIIHTLNGGLVYTNVEGRKTTVSQGPCTDQIS